MHTAITLHAYTNTLCTHPRANAHVLCLQICHKGWVVVYKQSSTFLQNDTFTFTASDVSNATMATVVIVNDEVASAENRTIDLNEDEVNKPEADPKIQALWPSRKHVLH